MLIGSRWWMDHSSCRVKQMYCNIMTWLMDGTGTQWQNITLNCKVMLLAEHITLRVEKTPMYTLNATGVHGVSNNMAVRKLTPVECERLQGFPDNYTNIKENCPDGHRYKAMGNSMAVPVMRWIGERINNYKEENYAV